MTYHAITLLGNQFARLVLRCRRQLYSIPNNYHAPEWLIDSFRVCVNHSGFAITVLNILGVSMRDYALVDILECLPQLEALVTEEPGSDNFSEKVEAEGCKLSWLTNQFMDGTDC
jgi:hypothetical protein